MKKLLWINIILLLFCYSCASTRSVTIYYREPSASKLTLKPIIVRTTNNNTSIAKSILLDELQKNGYEIIQDTESTKKLLKPFGVSQVVPTKDFTEILVSMELDDIQKVLNCRPLKLVYLVAITYLKKIHARLVMGQ